MSMFDEFAAAFPADPLFTSRVNEPDLTAYCGRVLEVAVPSELRSFWREIGSGYFGDRMLYFFGDDQKNLPRDSFKIWNEKDFWRLVYPAPKQGGPVFFAETCFGDQLGFRWESGECLFVLFVVDTFEAFVVAKNGAELFEMVLGDRYALVDIERHSGVVSQLGELPPGMHYAPLLSPMLGGTGVSENFCVETPNVHLRTAIETYRTKRPVRV